MSTSSCRLSHRPLALVTPATLAAIGLLAGAAAFAQTKPGPIPIAEFVKRGSFSAPALSPDGKYLVLTQRTPKDVRDEYATVVYELAGMKMVSAVRAVAADVPLRYVWVGDTRFVMTLGREFGSLEAPPATGELAAMNVDGRGVEYLYGYDMFKRSRRGGTMPDDEGYASIAHVPDVLDEHFLITENLFGVTASSSRLYDINSTNAGRKLVTEVARPGFDFLTQADGKPRFASGLDDDADYSLLTYDDDKRAWSEFRSAEKGDLRPISIAVDSSSMIARLSVQRGPYALTRQGLDGENAVTLARDPVGSIDMTQWGAKRVGPFAAATAVGIPKLRYFDEQGSDTLLHKTLSAQFPGDYVSFINYSRDGNRLLFSVWSDRDPGAYYIFDRVSGRAALLFETMPWIAPQRMAPRRAIQFKARDGLEIHGYLTLPVNRAEGSKPPLVLLPHGGPHGVADKWEFDTDVQFLASRGYAVLQVNYRGSGGRGPGFITSGYRQWGGKVQDDLIDGVRWAIDQGAVDGARVCAFGASFGAYSAMMTTIRAPGMFKCAIGYAGLYDLPLIYDEPRTRSNRRTFNYTVKVIGQDQAELAVNSPSRLADKLTVPVLLVHGSADTITPPVQADAMRDALKKAGRPPEWLYVSGEGHGFFSEANRTKFYEALEAFLAKHIGK